MDAGSRAPTVGALGDAGAVADDCKDAGGRATQEQLPTTARMQEVEQRRSSCREGWVRGGLTTVTF